MLKKLMKLVDLGGTEIILDHSYLGCTHRECNKKKNIILEEYLRCSNNELLLKQLKNCMGRGNQAKPVVWSYDMESHGKKHVERCCDKKAEQLNEVSSPCPDENHVKKEELESIGELPKACSQMVLNCLCLANPTFCGLSPNLHELSLPNKWHTQSSNEE